MNELTQMGAILIVIVAVHFFIRKDLNKSNTNDDIFNFFNKRGRR